MPFNFPPARKTPLMFALLADATKDMVELLLNWGAMTSTPEGQSVLHWVTGSEGSVSEEVKALLTGEFSFSFCLNSIFHNFKKS